MTTIPLFSVLLALVVGLVCINANLLPNIRIATSTLPANMKAQGFSWRSVGWATTYGQPQPIYLGFTSSGTLKVAWSDATNGHISTFDSSDTLSSDHVLPYPVRGLVVHDDGSYGVLLWNNPACSIAKYDSNNNQVWSTTLETDRCSDFSLGDSRLTYGFLASRGGNRYQAYYKVHGTTTGNCAWANGHEGDSLSYIDDNGAAEQVWCWGAGIGGCSHSMGLLISYNAAVNDSAPMCVTDCYPAATSTSNAIGGLYAKGSFIHYALANCGGTYGGELGGVALTPSGWILTFNVPNANIGINDASLGSRNYDLGVVKVDYAGGAYTVGGISWLTSTSQNEIFSSIAKYGNNYFVGFAKEQQVNASVGIERRFYIGLIDSNGKWVGATEDVTATVGWGERNGFTTAPNGDVVWVYPYTSAPGASGAYNTPTNQLKIFRLSTGASAVSSSSPASILAPFWSDML